MQEPFFSVIIPCYNSIEFIEDTLQSLKDQQFKDFEVVLIDDLSTDGSFEKAKKLFEKFEFNGKCLLKDISKYPKGVSGARNMGIDHSQGKWLCFLDSDDLFTREKLQGCYDIIEKNPHIEAMHHAIIEFEDKTGKELKQVIIKEFSGIHDKLPVLLSLNNICTSAVCLKRSLLSKIGNFNTNLNGIEDYYMWLLISKHTQWYYAPSCWTRYRIRKESLMGNKPMKHYIKQNMRLLQLLKNNQLFSKGEFKLAEKYLAKNLMTYYANNSVNRFGYFKTLLSLFELIKYGYFDTFTNNAFRITKNWLLYKTVKFIKSIK
jgi:glycosyltransferase involved in cell wall biosynthesis